MIYSPAPKKRKFLFELHFPSLVWPFGKKRRQSRRERTFASSFSLPIQAERPIAYRHQREAVSIKEYKWVIITGILAIIVSTILQILPKQIVTPLPKTPAIKLIWR